MTFPSDITLAGFRIHPHPLFEAMGYFAGFQTYVVMRRRWMRPEVTLEAAMWMIVACIFGALFGSKLLAWLESPGEYLAHLGDPRVLLGGKSIVGGLLGGWLGVEIAKRKLGIHFATGDVYVFPLIVGMVLGRIGCFLTGLDDHTHGVGTSLPWGVDFGDGVARHPTQLYEIAFLVSLGACLAWRARRAFESGYLFRLFLFSYFAFRFMVEFIKPTFHPWLGLSAIQLASVAGMVACRRIFKREPLTSVKA